MKRSNVFRRTILVLLIGILTAVGVAEAIAQTGESGDGPPSGQRQQVSLFGGSPYEGGYLKYSYKVSRENVAGYSLTTTEIIPEDDGMYRIESASTNVVPLEGVSIAFFGIPLSGLGFRIPSNTGGTVDLSPLSAVDDEVLEPNREYVLPDGGFLTVGDAGVIAGLDVVFATYTHADFTNVRINLAMPQDLEIRNLLPIFPYLQLEYESDTLPEEGADDDYRRMRSFSQIELIEFIYEP